MRTALAVLAVLVVVFWIFGFAVLIAQHAKAHEWYPRSCCSSRDCFEVTPGVDVRTVRGGYLVVVTGEFIPMERTRETPPEGRGHWARCTRDGDPTKPTLGMVELGYGGLRKACLFVPPARF